jgi:hypothetical protein
MQPEMVAYSDAHIEFAGDAPATLNQIPSYSVNRTDIA